MRLHPAKLVLSDSLDTVVIRPEIATAADGVVCREWDLGAPTIRENVVDRPGADGAVDTTLHIGARTVSFDLVIRGDDTVSAYEYVDRLTAMTHPYRRPELVINRTNNPPQAVAGEWRMRLRGNPYSVVFGRRAAAMIEMQLSFSAPDGVLEGATRGLSTEGNAVTNDDGNDGLILPTPFPWTMGGAGRTGRLMSFVVSGVLPVQPNLIIYGPVTNPYISTSDDEEFSLPGLTVASGEFVTVSMSNGQALLNGDPALSVYDYIDFTESSFWSWKPGERTVTMAGQTGQLVVQWRERRLTI